MNVPIPQTKTGRSPVFLAAQRGQEAATVCRAFGPAGGDVKGYEGESKWFFGGYLYRHLLEGPGVEQIRMKPMGKATN